MTAYERQIMQTEEFYDRQMALTEGDGTETLSSDVPDSRLHEILHNPHTEGIAEG